MATGTFRLGLLILLAAAASPLAAADDAKNLGPEAVVKALYHQAIHHFTGFSPASVKADQPWVTPGLYKRLVKKAKMPASKDEAPGIEGDLFLDAQTAPIGFEIGKSQVDQERARVEVTLLWPGEKRLYTVFLQLSDGGWKIRDVRFDHDGNLTDLL